MIDIQSVSQGPVSPIFIICKEARTVTYGTINIPPISAAGFTQFVEPKRPDDVRCMYTCSDPIKSNGRLCKCPKNAFEKHAVLELLVSGLFRPFNKIEFSIDRCFQNIEFSMDRCFQNCFIFMKAFWEYPKTQTLVWPLSENFWLLWIDKSPDDSQECEGWIYLLNIKERKIFLTFYSTIKFILQICLEIRLNDHHYSENWCLC